MVMSSYGAERTPTWFQSTFRIMTTILCSHLILLTKEGCWLSERLSASSCHFTLT